MSTDEGKESPLSAAQLRRLINAVLPTNADLDAFCLDYFPGVKKRFSDSMDRVSKVTLLFEQVPLVEIFNRLRAETPQQVDAFRAPDQLEGVPRDEVVVGAIRVPGAGKALVRDSAQIPIVWCSCAPQDVPYLKELDTHLMALQRQGVLHLLPVVATDEEKNDLHILRASVIILLLSSDYLASPTAARHIEAALHHQTEGSATVISVLVRPALWQATPLATFAPPLLDGQAISTVSDRDQAWTEVVAAVRQAILFPPTSRRASVDASSSESAPRLAPSLPIEEIFAHTGQPGVTYVETEQGRQLRQRLRKMGEGLVVEGPSGVGKTTAVRRALEDLDQWGRTTYVLGTDPEDLTRLDELVSASLPAGGHLVVDDFHRLDPARQKALGLLIKRLSDRNRRDAKVTLIGINPVGATLVQDLPEMPRYSVMQMRGQQTPEEIDALISSGEQAANVEFLYRAEFIAAADGSFAIAQRLCYEAALKAKVTETAPRKVVIEVRAAEVQRKVQEDLGYRYRALLLAFAACDALPPPRGAGLLLLWFLYKSTRSSVVVQEVRYQVQHIGWLNDAFEWIRQSNLSRHFNENPGLRRLLYYNVSTGVLSAEDPHLWFYLRHLDWTEFARACGHNHLAGWDPDRGPQFRSAPSDASLGARERPTSARPFTLLHLSDLHFSAVGQAALWRSQLAGDLRGELKIDQLDAVVLSGDITSRATEEEYHEALQFIRGVVREFSLLPHQVIPVPGNHDLSWKVSEAAYQAHVRKNYQGKLREGAYYEESKDSRYVEVRDERVYKSRFDAFAAYYQEVRREPYPLDPHEQGLVYYFPESEVLFLGLNSAWEIDHHYKARSGINATALSSGLDEIRNTPLYQQSRIKIGVFHHPIDGADEARIRDTGFVERLAQAGFRAVLHGHIHEAADAEVRYYRRVAGLEVLGAGTFGAVGPERPSGVPLQYQVIEIEPQVLRVRSRRRIKETGAWEPDHRYRQAAGEPNLDHTEIAL